MVASSRAFQKVGGHCWALYATILLSSVAGGAHDLATSCGFFCMQVVVGRQARPVGFG